MLSTRSFNQIIEVLRAYVSRVRPVDGYLLLVVVTSLWFGDAVATALGARGIGSKLVLLLLLFLQLVLLRCMGWAFFNLRRERQRLTSTRRALGPTASSLSKNRAMAMVKSDESSDTGVTIVVPVRDREPYRLRNLLRSIRAQTYPTEKIKIAVVDYDSQLANASAYQALCSQYQAALYRIDNRPIWSRAEALNIGIRMVETRYTMIADVDIIYPSNYVTCAVDALEDNPLRAVCSDVLETGAYRIAHETDVVQEFSKIRACAKPRISEGAPAGYVYGQGLCCTRTAFLREIRGLDEFYRGWGSEDDDLIKRLRLLGVQPHSIADKAVYLHHSHAKLEGFSSQETEYTRWNREYLHSTSTIQRNPDAWGCSNLDIEGCANENGVGVQYRFVQPPKCISVVVRVNADSGALRGCLEALNRQANPPKTSEVILVVDLPGEDSSAALVEFPEFRCPLKVISRSAFGTQEGRAGVRGELVALTDADCLPQPDWLERGYRYFFGPHAVGYVVGRTLASRGGDSKPTWSARCDAFFASCQSDISASLSFSPTANLFCTKEGFESMDLCMDPLEPSGVRESILQAKQKRLKTVYAEDVVVEAPVARDLLALIRRQIRCVSQEFYVTRLSGIGHLTALWRLLPKEFIVKLQAVYNTNHERYLRRLARVVGLACGIAIVRAVRSYELIRMSCGGQSRRL